MCIVFDEKLNLITHVHYGCMRFVEQDVTNLQNVVHTYRRRGKAYSGASFSSMFAFLRGLQKLARLRFEDISE